MDLLRGLLADHSQERSLPVNIIDSMRLSWRATEKITPVTKKSEYLSKVK